MIDEEWKTPQRNTMIEYIVTPTRLKTRCKNCKKSLVNKQLNIQDENWFGTFTSGLVPVCNQTCQAILLLANQ